MFVLIGMAFFVRRHVVSATVKTDCDRSANFTQYKTYSWEHARTRDPLDVGRIKNAVNVALAAGVGPK
jgi:Domain of unknown function (DUF4136)